MIPAQIIQRGKGKGRNPWRIREFLSTLKKDDGSAMNMSDVARMAATWPQVAQETIRGTRNHTRVLDVLAKLGCPEEYLYGPAGETVGRAA